MKAILEFNLPDDDAEFKEAIKGNKYYSALWEMDQWLRSNTKYAPDTMTDDTYKAYDLCRNKLKEFMFNEDVSFNI